MIKTVVIPQNNNISVLVPDNYIGKEIEVLLYAREELEGVKATKDLGNVAARFKGLLNNDEAGKFDSYLQKARKEWE